MKKKIIIIVLLVICFSSISTFAQEQEVTIDIPEFVVRVNGSIIDAERGTYPILRYKGITYFPMTWEYVNGMNLSLKWDNDTGLEINQKDSTANFKQELLDGNYQIGSKHKATIANYPIKVNGKKIDNLDEDYPILNYKSITYFPMTWRFAVTEFGWEYTWDNNEGFGINIPNAEYSYEEDSSYKEKNDYALKSNPIRFNNTIEVLTKYQNGDEFTSNFKLVELIRGEKANALVAEANMFNDAPKAGYEYLMVKFIVEVLDGTNSSVQFMQNKYNFALISEVGEEYDYASVVSPQPEFDAKLYKGASHEGYIVFEVRETDKKPLIANGRSSDGSGGVWYQAFTRDGSEYVEVVAESYDEESNVDTESTEITDTPQDYDLNTTIGIEQYLEEKYSTLETSLGNTTFKFEVYKNDVDYIDYDYWIQVEYKYGFFYDLQYSINVTEEQRTKVKGELKNHIEKLGKDLVQLLPTKKLYGGYYDSWYKYPNLKVDLQTRRYYSWTNYNESDILSDTPRYHQTEASHFRWWDFIDDEL